MTFMDNKSRVFETARKISAKEGLSGLTMRRLAKEADISVGSIYNLFGTKDRLVMDLIENYWIESLSSIMEDERISSGSFIERLEYLYSSFQKTSNKFHDDWIKDMVGMNMSNPDILKKSNKYKSIIEEKIEEMIRVDENIMQRLANDEEVESFSRFIFENMMIQLSNEEEDLGFFKKILEELLEKK